MFNEVVQPLVKNVPNGIFKNMKITAPKSASGTEPNKTMNGSRKLLNCAASTKTINSLDLRNDLVTAASDVETINIIPADGCGEISSHLLHVQAKRSHFVVIE